MFWQTIADEVVCQDITTGATPGQYALHIDGAALEHVLRTAPDQRGHCANNLIGNRLRNGPHYSGLLCANDDIFRIFYGK
ncbi:hypothetical protein [Microbulbifer aggregans]|uniref:hypothetical protein n=1 Tax=Microbulbifer aggregans TaxID=1769779 RepID=UPI001CFD514E|nr:hypothetical protein [Microbulbifer aggregans]